MTPTPTTIAAAKVRAEERFKEREQRATDARKVLQDLADLKVAERAKTDRLRTLRLEKEAADQAAAAARPPVARRSTARATTKRAAPRVTAAKSGVEVE